MARRKTTVSKVLLGAEEFAGPDAEQEAIEKIAAARAAAEKETGDNGGPLLDEAAWQRACNEYMAEMLAIEDLNRQKAEISGRISSIRKVAKKLGVDWDTVKRYHEDHKRIRKGGMGALVTGERRYRNLLKLMRSPLGTQFSLWDVEAEEPERHRPGPFGKLRAGMDAELQGQHAFSNREDRGNNPFTQGTEDFVAWDTGFMNAMSAAAREMAPA